MLVHLLALIKVTFMNCYILLSGSVCRSCADITSRAIGWNCSRYCITRSTSREITK